MKRKSGRAYSVSKKLDLPTLAVCLAGAAVLTVMLGLNLFRGYELNAATEGESRLMALRQAITMCTNTTGSLAEVIRLNQGRLKDPDWLIESVYNSTDAPIRSVQLAPQGKVTYVYPEEGNEAGKIDLFADPQRREEAIAARDSGNLMLAGPFTLKQGGFGVAIRQPVYLIPDDISSFWGFSIVVADMDRLLDYADFDSIGKFNYSYRLTAVVNGEEVYVDGSLPEGQGVLSSMEFEDKTWNLYVKPGFRRLSRMVYYGFALSMFVLSFLIAALRARNRSLVDSTLTDALTGLRNRRGFDRAMRDMAGDKRTERALIVAIDINNFKTFNDLYGHDNGDELLKDFAQELHSLVGRSGIISRNGGDEFQILIKNPKGDWERKLREFFNRSHTFLYHGKDYLYNVSGGCAVYPDQDTDFAGLYRKADTALYHAKTSPESRFWLYSDQMSREPREQIGFNFKDLSAGAPGAVLIYKADRGEEILFANEMCVHLFGCDSLADFMSNTGGSFRTLVDPEDSAWAEESIRRQQADPANTLHSDYLVYRARRKDGTIISLIDVGRKIHHEYYGDIFYVFLLNEDDSEKFDRRP